MKTKTSHEKYQIKKCNCMLGLKQLLAFALFAIIISTFFIEVVALPSGPVITYVSNSTYVSVIPNRSDIKGTITTVKLSLNQQDYKWKAYVGNVSGKFALGDSNGKNIYDWSLGASTGKVYASKDTASVNWVNVSCANQSLIDNEEISLSMSTTAIDNINNTFINTTHKGFQVGTKPIAPNTCRSAAMYQNSLPQTLTNNSNFQEVLLMDTLSSSLIYTAQINASTLGYDGSSLFDFQMIVAENESATTPTLYYFYLELT